MSYDEVKDKASTLRAMTSLDRAEFEQLAVAFAEVWREQQAQAGKDVSKGGRPAQLRTVKQKLLFILFYLKTYPLQEVLGHLFGLSQGQANVWLDRLSGVLKQALEQRGDLPARWSSGDSILNANRDFLRLCILSPEFVPGIAAGIAELRNWGPRNWELRNCGRFQPIIHPRWTV